jgi:hypothetical protein
MASAILTICRRKNAAIFTALAGMAILIFLSVEILTIGSPHGVARNLQLLYLGVGLILLFLASVMKTNRR